MASLLFTIGGAVVNALAFSGTNFVFSRLTDHGAEERKRHDLALEKLQRARDKWNENQMKQPDFINKRLHKTQAARAYINNADGAILEYYQVFAKTITSLPPEPQLPNFYLQKKLSLYHSSLSYQIFIIHQRLKKMVNYYLL